MIELATIVTEEEDNNMATCWNHFRSLRKTSRIHFVISLMATNAAMMSFHTCCRPVVVGLYMANILESAFMLFLCNIPFRTFVLYCFVLLIWLPTTICMMIYSTQVIEAQEANALLLYGCLSAQLINALVCLMRFFFLLAE